MDNAAKKDSPSKTNPFFRIRFWDVITGLPAGVLIFMATVLFSALFDKYSRASVIAPVVILVIVSLLVGVLAGISRLRQGPATALAAGLVAAGLLGYLWLAANPGDIFNPLVIGPIGIFITITVCPIGGWLGARLIKAL